MNRTESVPLGRIMKCLPERGTWFAPAYQGPGGLFAIRAHGLPESPPMFQVMRVYGRRGGNPADDREVESVSEPWMTYEGADQFAQRLAGGGESRIG